MTRTPAAAVPVRHKSTLACALLVASVVVTAAVTVMWIPEPGQGSRATQAAEPEVDLPLPPAEAAAAIAVPAGFQVTLFAGEPDVRQPISFCIDDRGRLWVAEAFSYPKHSTTGNDRIVIFEDENGDGKFDHKTVFYDQLNYVTGIEVGLGGAWVVTPPSMLFIPDRDGDDRPDGSPQVVLDGFGTHANSHNLANALAWGPDGWLYGTHGRTNWSLIGKPGTPESERIRFDGGVYRYHPTRQIWEAYADGTTNPWGIDWNDQGEAFVCNCVNPHLFHVIQGAHYEPWRNRESSRYAYERIASIADHLHFVGEANVRDGLGSSEEDEAGGGHAHCGTMVYLGDNWPASLRNSIFMHNIHGKRINNDIPRRAGSGYVATHGKDLVRSRDPWFMGVLLAYGPDGGVYSLDWSDTGECHSVRNTRKQTGRIFKIVYRKDDAGSGSGQGKSPGSERPKDVSRLDDAQLVELHLHPNDWFVRHARRVLQERQAAGRDLTEAHRRLKQLFQEHPDESRKLRAYWTLHATAGVDDAFSLHQLGHASEYVRGWAIRFLCEDRQPPAEAHERLRQLAASDSSSHVRLQIASALQRLPSDSRWPIAEALVAHAEDAADQNLPLMNWYAIEPLVENSLERFVNLAKIARQPMVIRHIARRSASLIDNTDALEQLVKLLPQLEPNSQRDLLDGVLVGLEGRRRVKRPSGWSDAYAKLRSSVLESVREDSLELALLFDDPTALAELRQQATSNTVPVDLRRRAVRSLVAKKSDGVAVMLLDLIADADLRAEAVRGLAEFDHPETVTTLLEHYAKFDPATKQDALQTLASRPAWAHRLLDELESKRIARGEITAYTARQLDNLKDAKLAERVRALWGELRTTPADKARAIADFKKRLTPQVIRGGDRAAGRIVFQANCANCHKLFDAGGAIGPELTGAQRFNLDYLLENLIDPSALVAKDFQMQVIETEAGRVVTGLVVDETPASITVQTLNEKLVIPRGEIAGRTNSPLSLMPEGVLQKLTIGQARDLIAYLSGQGQVPLPAAAP